MEKPLQKEAVELWNYVTHAAIDAFNDDADETTLKKRADYFHDRLIAIVEKTKGGETDEKSKI